MATSALVQSFNSTVSGPEVAGASAGNTAALTVLQSSDTSAAVAANQLNLTTAVADDDLASTLGNLRAVQAATIAQMQNDAQSLLDSSDNALYLNIGVIIFALLLSFVGTVFVARSLTGPLSLLRAAALDIASTRLPEMVRRLRDADAATADANSRVDPIPITSSDEIGEVARSFDEVHQQAVRLASEQAMLRANVNSMFVNLSRRSQSLVQRQLRLIDELENSEQDPDQLANLFKLDHLATRMRRNGENLLVLAGEEPGRKWSQAVRAARRAARRRLRGGAVRAGAAAGPAGHQRGRPRRQRPRAPGRRAAGERDLVLRAGDPRHGHREHAATPAA